MAIVVSPLNSNPRMQNNHFATLMAIPVMAIPYLVKNIIEFFTCLEM
jgi:hypothetical protein